METLPEQLLERMRRFDLSRPLAQQMSKAESRALSRINNCKLWLMLSRVSATAMEVKARREAWQTYVEQRKIHSQAQLFSEPEQLSQRAAALYQEVKQFDLNKSYWEQMGVGEQRFVETLIREVPLVEEFVRWLEERK
jgi:hypothetical protein